jgi:uncharacterized delta-60 repeat protein
LVAAIIGLVLAVPAGASPGAVDSSFGSAGVAALPFKEIAAHHAVAVQRDGRILVVGATLDAGYRFHLAVARLTSSGALDQSYASNGVLRTSLPVDPGSVGGVVVDAAGRALIGFIDLGVGAGEAAVARLLPNGSFDKTFGVNGVAHSPPQAGVPAFHLTSIALQRVAATQKIVMVGSVDDATGFAAERFNPDGSLDRTFGARGTALAALPEYSSPWSVAVQSDGKLVLSGFVSQPSNPFGLPKFDMALVRFAANGQLDPTFGVTGVAIDVKHGSISSGQPGKDLAIGPRGGIAVVTDSKETIYNDDFAIERFLPNGRPDANFGMGGFAAANLGGFEYANALAIGPDGRVVAVGTIAHPGTKTGKDFALARFLPNGHLDPTYGVGGIVITHWPGYVSTYATGVVLTGTKLVVAGFQALVTRYET